jgi:hypothetical protein
MSSIDELLAAAAERGAERAMSRRDLAPPAPYPVGVSIAGAARLLSVGKDKVRALLAEGRIRRLDLGDSERPGARVVISTLSLFELDPGFTPEHRAQVIRLDLDQEPAA